MASATDGRVVKYAAIARLSDKTIVLSHTEHREATDFDSRVAAVLEHGKWASVKSHLLIRDGGNTMHVFIGKEQRVYFAITSNEYPQRFVCPSSSEPAASGGRPALLGEVRDFAEGEYAAKTLECGHQELGRAAKSRLAKLVARFNKLEDIDAIARVKGRLEEVKGAMADNIDLAIKSLDKTSEVEASSAELASTALTFKRAAATTERAMRWRACKWTLLIVFIVAAIIAAIVIPIATSN